MSDLPEEFHDPALRSAIQRAEGKATAPPALRDKIASMLAASAASGSLRPQKNRRRLPEMPRITARFAALAAIVLIAVGFAGMQIWDFVGDNAYHGPTVSRASISETLATSMVRTHNDCAKRADHHQVPGDDLKALQPQLTSSSGVNAFAAQLGDGWQFQGAGVYPIGGAKAAELFFSRGDQTASVFSMKSEPGICLENEVFDEMIDHRALAAVSQSGSLYAVVISQSAAGDPSLATAQGLLKTVEISVLGSCPTCGGAQPTTATSPAVAPPPATR